MSLNPGPLGSKILNAPCWTVMELNLFDVEEVLGIEGDAGTSHRNIFIQSSAVTDISPHGKCHRFGLKDTI